MLRSAAMSGWEARTMLVTRWGLVGRDFDPSSVKAQKKVSCKGIVVDGEDSSPDVAYP